MVRLSTRSTVILVRQNHPPTSPAVRSWVLDQSRDGRTTTAKGERESRSDFRIRESHSWSDLDPVFPPWNDLGMHRRHCVGHRAAAMGAPPRGRAGCTLLDNKKGCRSACLRAPDPRPTWTPLVFRQRLGSNGKMVRRPWCTGRCSLCPCQRFGLPGWWSSGAQHMVLSQTS